jgi:hypothetical protein
MGKRSNTAVVSLNNTQSLHWGLMHEILLTIYVALLVNRLKPELTGSTGHAAPYIG